MVVKHLDISVAIVIIIIILQSGSPDIAYLAGAPWA